MKKRVCSMILAVCMIVGMFTTLVPPSLAAEAEIISSITIKAPDSVSSDLQITLTNVNRTAQMHSSGNIYVFLYDNSTIRFSRDVVVELRDQNGNFTYAGTIDSGKVYTLVEYQTLLAGWQRDDGSYSGYKSDSFAGFFYSAGIDNQRSDATPFDLYDLSETPAPVPAIPPAATLPTPVSTAPTIANIAADEYVARQTSSTVLVNGNNVAFDAYTINENNYFKLRDLAFVLWGTKKQFSVEWDGINNAISLSRGEPYTMVGGELDIKTGGDKTAYPTNSTIFLDGQEVRFTAYTIDGNNYFKLRDVGEAFNFGVNWDGLNNTILVNTNRGYTPDAEKGTASPIDIKWGFPTDYLDPLHEDFTYREDFIVLHQLADQYLSECAALMSSNMSDAERIKVIHDYICSKYVYGFALTLATDPYACFPNGLEFAIYATNYSPNSADVYHDLTEFKQLLVGDNVCGGYSMTFGAFMKYLCPQVPVYSIASIPMDHSWNAVLLDGKVYHIDLTWDDDTIVSYWQFLKARHTGDDEASTLWYYPHEHSTSLGKPLSELPFAATDYPLWF